jgi:cell pole-organizing protein PopZ
MQSEQTEAVPMSDADGQQEPSMEEILASIRRIISEDGEDEGESEAAAEANQSEEAAEPAPLPEPEAEPAPEPMAAEEELVTEDLPEVPLEDEPEPAPLGDDDDDVLELTEMVENDGTVVDLSQARGGEPYLPEDADDALLGVSDDGDESVLSDHAAAAAAGSLAALTTAAGRKIADNLGTSDIGGLTLEQLVRELLRPMMREWLDQNLPPMVERMVRREIERVSKLQGL